MRKVLIAFCFSVLTVSAIFSCTAVADTLIDDFTAAGNDRFTNDAGFVLSEDLSGVARDTTDGFWGTLIGRNSFLTAAHRVPRLGRDLAFYPGNDPSATPFLGTVVGGEKVAGTDLYVGYLNRDIDPSIRRYAFASEPLSGTPSTETQVTFANAGSFQNDVGFIVGISPTARSIAEIDQSIGLNRVRGYAENVQFLGNADNDAIIYEYNDRSDSPYVTNEALVNGGDSGAPNFIFDTNGELILLGVNSFRLDGQPVEVTDLDGNLTTQQFRSSGITYTGNQFAEINRLISLAPTAVPEPSSLILFPVVASLMSLRRRRSIAL